jgi:hypothetical protein
MDLSENGAYMGIPSKRTVLGRKIVIRQGYPMFREIRTSMNFMMIVENVWHPFFSMSVSQTIPMARKKKKKEKLVI